MQQPACGIWLWKYLAMRPPEVWEKAYARDAEVMKKRASRKKKTPSPLVKMQKALPSLETLHANQATREGSSLSVSNGDSTAHLITTSTQQTAISSVSAQQGSTSLKLLESVEVETVGSKNSPIELDEETSPKPTRRLIFPSPRRAGEVKSLEFPSGTSATTPSKKATNNHPVDPEDKENQRPVTDDEEYDGVAHLFSGQVELPRIPTTPKSTSSATLATFKTPTPGNSNRILSPKGFLSSAAKRWRESIMTPSRMGGGSAHAHALSPFTAELTRMLSHQSPSRSNSNDHSNLGMFGDELVSDHDFFNFSDFSTDGNGFGMEMSGLTHSFSLYEDPSEATAGAGDSCSVAGLLPPNDMAAGEVVIAKAEPDVEVLVDGAQ